MASQLDIINAALYGRDPGQQALEEYAYYEAKTRARIAEQLVLPPKYLMPSYFGMDLAKPSTSNMETKMPLVEPKPLSHPVQLLVNALNSAKSVRDTRKSCAERSEINAKAYRKEEALYDTKVVELTKALKKLGHKA